MNVIDILNKLGWEIVSLKNGYYEVQMTTERYHREFIKRKNGEIEYDKGFDPKGIFEIYVDKVSFNDLGNLYVSFREVDSNNLFDMYEYKNMRSDEIY